MERTRKINFGKVDGYDCGIKNCGVIATISIRETEWGPEFMAMANVTNHIGTDLILGGQCLDEILSQFSDNLKDEGVLEEFQILHSLWKNFHLNAMYAGTIEQEGALLEHFGSLDASHYKEHVEYLKSVNLYEVPWTKDVKVLGFKEKDHPATYKYGNGWLYRDIPEMEMKKIQLIMDKGMTGLKKLVEEEKDQEIPEEELEIE